MAETVPTFLIHNMFKAQSSRVQRAHSPVPHTANERLMGRRIIPKRPIRITEEEFKANEAEILSKIREGRLAVTCPDQSFIDSLPDGRLIITYLNKKTEEEPSSPAYQKWPFKGAVGPQGAPGAVSTGTFHGDATGPTGSLGDLTKDEIFRSDPVPYPDPPGPRTEPELSPQPEAEPVAPAVEPVPPTEDLTTELVNPNEALLETQVPPVQDTITLDTPKKGKKRNKE